MSSNIRIKRICQFCDKEFEARTTVTKHCSDNCSKRAYKARKKESKIETSNKQTLAIKQKPIIDLKAKEFLTVRDVAKLLNCSRQTVYTLIDKGTIRAKNLSERKTIIKREHLDDLFESNSKMDSKSLTNKPVDINNCYTISEVLKTYQISEKALYEIIKRNNLVKIKRGKFTYIAKDDVERILNPLNKS